MSDTGIETKNLTLSDRVIPTGITNFLTPQLLYIL